MRWQDVSNHLSYSSYKDEKNSTVDKWSLTDTHYIETLYGGTAVLNMLSVAKPLNTTKVLNYAAPLNFSDTIAFSDSPSPLADVFMMYGDESKPYDDPRPFSAVEFVLEWCAQEFNTSVVNGVVSTTRLGSTNNFTTEGVSSYTGPLFNTTTDFRYEYIGVKYYVGYSTHNILSDYLRKTLNGSVYLVQEYFYKTSDAAEAFYEPFDVQALNISSTIHGHPGLVRILQNIATSMTNM